MQQLTFRWCQRWRRRRESYRPAREPVDVRRYSVEAIEEKNAKAFVLEHHYSGSYPVARARFGLFERTRGLVGVAVFSVPMNPRTVGRYAPGTDPSRGVELGRFVLLDQEPANAETFFLGRSFALLRDAFEDLEVVLSFADPVRRTTVNGDQICPGHVGLIYQAHNGHYAGRSKPGRLLLGPDGRSISPRSLSKIRNGEKGGDRGGYAHRNLLSHGAPEWRRGESGEGYLERVLRSGVFRSLRHPGNYAYLWSLGRSRTLRRQVARRFRGAAEYPKKVAA